MSSKSLASRRASTGTVIATFLLSLFALVVCIRHWHGDKHALGSANAQREGELLRPVQPTLVIYLLSFADAAYIENFNFFFLEAIARDTTAEYEILLPKGHGQDALLPDLPPHARYIEHDRNCRGLSLVRWHLSTRPDEGHRVERFVLVSSAVRGPFIPPGLRDSVTWHVALGLGLAGSGAGRKGSGLAGGIVSCAQPPERWGLEDSEPPLNPFLEFTALAASRAAIEELLRLPAQQLRECPAAATAAQVAPSAGTGVNAGADAAAAGGSSSTRVVDSAAVVAMEGLTVAEAEAMGSLRAWTGAVLAAGMGLWSLAARQQDVDWADPRTWTCNGGSSPFVERAHDGLSLLPYEAMFLPVSEYDNGDMPYGAAAEYSLTYTEWIRAWDPLAASLLPLWAPQSHLQSHPEEQTAVVPAAEGGDGDDRNGSGPSRPSLALAANVTVAVDVAEDLADRNRYLSLSSQYKLPGVLVAVAQGEGCFDAEYFLRANPDVVGLSPHEAWKFFVFYAQFQPRAYRLKCGMDWSKFGLRGSGGRRKRGAGGSSGRPASRRTQDPR